METLNQGERMTIEEEFTAAWNLYPRKEGKSDSLRHFRKLKPTERIQIVDAIKNYVRVIEVEQRAHRHTLVGSTFFYGRWRDYLEYQPVVPVTNRPKTMAEQLLGREEQQSEQQRLN